MLTGCTGCERLSAFICGSYRKPQKPLEPGIYFVFNRLFFWVCPHSDRRTGYITSDHRQKSSRDIPDQRFPLNKFSMLWGLFPTFHFELFTAGKPKSEHHKDLISQLQAFFLINNYWNSGFAPQFKVTG